MTRTDDKNNEKEVYFVVSYKLEYNVSYEYYGVGIAYPVLQKCSPKLGLHVLTLFPLTQNEFFSKSSDEILGRSD